MRKNLWIVIVGIVVVVVVVIMVPCRLCREYKPRMFVYTIVDPCSLKDTFGNDVTEIRVPRSTPIKWVNETNGQVAIAFSDPEIVGAPSFKIESGADLVTTTSGSGFNGTVHFKCAGIDGPTPPIKDCPPPPAPCP
jgi:hypothetical protein